MAVASWLVSRAALRRLAACERSVASGSCMPRMATAACSTRMGSVSFGMSRKASTSAAGIGRAAHSSARQVVDVEAAIGEAAVRAVQIAELGLGGDHTLESPDQLCSFRHGWLL